MSDVVIHRTMLASRACWWWTSSSCMGQKWPWSAAASVRWAVASAWGWTWVRGRCAEGHAAVGALVVAVRDQGDRGPLAAAPVVAVQVHRRREVVDDRAHRITSSTASVNSAKARWRASLDSREAGCARLLCCPGSDDTMKALVTDGSVTLRTADLN